MYDLRVIVAVVVLHQLDIRTCTAEIVAIKFVNYFSSACPNIELVEFTFYYAPQWQPV